MLANVLVTSDKPKNKSLHLRQNFIWKSSWFGLSWDVFDAIEELLHIVVEHLLQITDEFISISCVPFRDNWAAVVIAQGTGHFRVVHRWKSLSSAPHTSDFLRIQHHECTFYAMPTDDSSILWLCQNIQQELPANKVKRVSMNINV